MDNKSDVEKALEDLFGESFDEEKEKTKENVNESISSKNNYKFEDGKDEVVVPIFKDDDKEKLSDDNHEIKKVETNINNDNNTNKDINLKNDIDIKENTNINISLKDDTNINKNPNKKVDTIIKKDNKLSSSHIEKTKKVSLKDKYFKNINNITILTIAIILCFIASILIVLFNTNKEQIVSCSFSAKDKGYKIMDEYIIAHKSGRLTFIQGQYSYTATNDESKKQIEVIKESKLPVIINSNGMPGFTHTYEISSDFIKVYSYYDITKMNFNKVDKNNDEITPISYINIKSTTTYDSLTKELKKQGYKCIKSK